VTQRIRQWGWRARRGIHIKNLRPARACHLVPQGTRSLQELPRNVCTSSRPGVEKRESFARRIKRPSVRAGRAEAKRRDRGLGARGGGEGISATITSRAKNKLVRAGGGWNAEDTEENGGRGEDRCSREGNEGGEEGEEFYRGCRGSARSGAVIRI